jgi:hypothetical protein
MYETIFNWGVTPGTKKTHRQEFCNFLARIRTEQSVLKNKNLSELYKQFIDVEQADFNIKNKLFMLLLIDCNITLASGDVPEKLDVVNLMDTTVSEDLNYGEDWVFQPQDVKHIFEETNKYIGSEKKSGDLGSAAFLSNYDAIEPFIKNKIDGPSRNLRNTKTKTSSLMLDTMTQSLVLVSDTFYNGAAHTLGWDNINKILVESAKLYVDRLAFLKKFGGFNFLAGANPYENREYKVGGVEELLIYKNLPPNTPKSITQMKIKAFQEAFNGLYFHGDEEGDVYKIYKQKALFVVYGDLEDKKLDEFIKFSSYYTPYVSGSVSLLNICEYLYSKNVMPHMSLPRANALNASLLIPYAPNVNYKLDLVLRTYENTVYKDKKMLTGRSEFAKYFYWLLVSEDTEIKGENVVFGDKLRRLISEFKEFFGGITDIHYLCPFFHTAIRIMTVHETRIKDHFMPFNKKDPHDEQLLSNMKDENITNKALNNYLIECLDMDCCSVGAMQYKINKFFV